MLHHGGSLKLALALQVPTVPRRAVGLLAIGPAAADAFAPFNAAAVRLCDLVARGGLADHPWSPAPQREAACHAVYYIRMATRIDVCDFDNNFDPHVLWTWELKGGVAVCDFDEEQKNMDSDGIEMGGMKIVYPKDGPAFMDALMVHHSGSACRAFARD